MDRVTTYGGECRQFVTHYKSRYSTRLPSMQNPDGAAAAAIQRQPQQFHGQAAAIQWDTAESLALLREVVLQLTQLPPEAWRSLAHHHPDTVDDLIRQLEDWQVAQQLRRQAPDHP